MNPPTSPLAAVTQTLCGALLLLSLSTRPVMAQSATWLASPGTGDWNTAGNWTGSTVPNAATDTATFGVSSITGVSLSANTLLGSIAFNSGASAFTITATPTFTLTLSGTGITNNSGVTQNFVTAMNGSSSDGHIIFTNSATAGSQTLFTNNGGTASGAGGGTTTFYHNTNAGSGTFTNNGGTVSGALGGLTVFSDSATAGSGTFTADGGTGGGNGGSIRFLNDSTGGTARVEVFGNGNLDISGHSVPGVSIGSIEGSGNVFLGANNLTVGSNNLSTTFSGVMQDGGGLGGGTGGSLTKIGTGTLTLSGANTIYTGGTAISAGTILANNASGSAFGTGPVMVASGATLGGGGFIGGLTTVASSGHLAPGNSPGTLTFTNGLTLATGAVLDFQLGTVSDLIAVTGGTLTGPAGTGGITLNLSNSGGFAPSVSYTLFNFLSGQTSSFDVADFAFGPLIGTTVASDYSFNLTATSLALTYNGSASAIPEPSTYAALFGVGALAFAGWRRRRGARV